METLTITIKTLFGFEEILKEEVESLGYKNVTALNRAVQLEGEWEDVYILNFKLRLAIAVLVKIDQFRVNSEDDLYKHAKKIDWTKYFEVDKTFAVKGAIFSTLFNHTMYPFLVVKDAIADVFREKYDKRPDVNTKSPQVMFDVYIKEKDVTISLNTSGVPLFQRGYRQETGEAPMNEVLAAGLLKLSGWDMKSTLIDPMCGSGTLAIEAALMAADIPAMIERQHYAFKNFKSFDAEKWDAIFNGANRRPVKLGFDIIASDNDAEVLQKAKRNSKIAPIGNMVQFHLKDFKEIEKPTEKGTLICNPPYGERMGEELEELYSEMGDFFKQKMTGFDCWIVTSNVDAVKFVGLKPDKKIKVFNGSLECTFRKFSIFEGTKKVKYQKEEGADKPSTDTKTPERDEKGERKLSRKEFGRKREAERAKLAEKTKNDTSSRAFEKKEKEKESESTEKPSKYNQQLSKYNVKPTYTKRIEKEGDNSSKEKDIDEEKSTKKEINVSKTSSKIDELKKYRKRED